MKTKELEREKKKNQKALTGKSIHSDNGGTLRSDNGGTGHLSKVNSSKLETHSTCVNTVSRLYSSLR